ncbi:MAG: class I SAM-dependent methyltransferase [Myxococcales bacterium]|nr:class I SAM-dependent methyltransferase [Myxococcales bacterium]
MTLPPDQITAYYDAHGAWQDRAAWYEDPALDRLVARGAFDRASTVIELGAGTGRFAERLLDAALPASARYVGVDLSATMCDLATARLARFGERAEICQGAAETISFAPGWADRVVSTWFFDLLPDPVIAEVIAHAHDWLRPGGLLCLANLCEGESWIGRRMASLWSAVHRRRPAWVGGCRPLDLTPRLAPGHWRIEHHSVVEPWGIPSEILVARRI